jgi:hypothetical protein
MGLAAAKPPLGTGGAALLDPLDRTGVGAALTGVARDEPSAPPGPIEPAILDGLRAMLRTDLLGSREISDRSRNLQDAIMAARGQTEAAHGGREETVDLGPRRAKPTQKAGCQLRVATKATGSESFTLPITRADDPRPRDGRRLRVVARAEIGMVQRGKLHVQVDAVEEGT